MNKKEYQEVINLTNLNYNQNLDSIEDIKSLIELINEIKLMPVNSDKPYCKPFIHTILRSDNVSQSTDAINRLNISNIFMGLVRIKKWPIND